jgi:hypothetical protein
MSVFKAKPYRERLDDALPDYRRITGRDPARERFDVELPGVRSTYARFKQPLASPSLGAKAGEWIALHAGLKPMVREVLSPADLEASQRRWQGQGLLSVEVAQPVSASARGHLGRDGDRIVVFVGTEQAALEEAAALEEEELRGARRTALTEFKGSQGGQLGYPDCCVAFFCGLGNLRDNRPAIAAAAAASKRFDPLLSNTVLSVYHHVSWYPCSYDCAKATEAAAGVREALAATHPDQLDAVDRLQAMPRLYIDDRLQLLCEGDWDGDAFVIRGVHTPYALDRRTDRILEEWMLYADLGQELRSRRRIDADAVWPDAAVWLPFGAPS